MQIELKEASSPGQTLVEFILGEKTDATYTVYSYLMPTELARALQIRADTYEEVT